MGKDKAPKGPSWKKLFKKLGPFLEQNQELFKEAMDFGKGQFTEGEKFVSDLRDYGMNAAGELGDQANNFNAMVDRQVAGLYGKADEFGAANKDIYGRNTEQADKLLGQLEPNIEALSRTGGKALSGYEEQGLPFQLDYARKLGEWDTTGRREARAAEGVADLSLARRESMESERLALERFGIDPSQTRAASLVARQEAQFAVAAAAEANRQRRAVEGEGLALGKEASGVYNEMAGMGKGLTGAATEQGVAAQGIGMAPGEQYLKGLGTVADIYGSTAGLEQAGKATGFDMGTTARKFGVGTLETAANLDANNRTYGSGIYSQGSGINTSGAGIVTGAGQMGAQLNANDLNAYNADQANSVWGQVGGLVGAVAPAALGSPWLGSFLKPKVAAARGGAIPDSVSPSRGMIKDDVPAALTAGEYVMDPDTVRWYGEKHFAGLQKKAAKEMADAAIPMPKQASLSNPRPNRAPALPSGAKAAGGIPMSRA